jgi:hypothetical protein
VRRPSVYFIMKEADESYEYNFYGRRREPTYLEWRREFRGPHLSMPESRTGRLGLDYKTEKKVEQSLDVY